MIIFSIQEESEGSLRAASITTMDIMTLSRVIQLHLTGPLSWVQQNLPGKHRMVFQLASWML